METILRMNREEGVTFLIVSHEMADLAPAVPARVGDARGQLIAEGSFEEVANHALGARGLPGTADGGAASSSTGSSRGTSRGSTS